MECSSSPQTYYSLLGVAFTASSNDIRVAFRRLARKWHPDKHYNAADATQRFQACREAYEVLSNPELRRQYDMSLVELFDIEEYLTKFQEVTLTASGLGIGIHPYDPLASPCVPQPFRRRWDALTAA